MRVILNMSNLKKIFLKKAMGIKMQTIGTVIKHRDMHECVLVLGDVQQFEVEISSVLCCRV